MRSSSSRWNVAGFCVGWYGARAGAGKGVWVDPIRELADQDPAHERFPAKVSVVKEQVQHHIEEDESELFPRST